MYSIESLLHAHCLNCVYFSTGRMKWQKKNYFKACMSLLTKSSSKETNLLTWHIRVLLPDTPECLSCSQLLTARVPTRCTVGMHHNDDDDYSHYHGAVPTHRSFMHNNDDDNKIHYLGAVPTHRSWSPTWAHQEHNFHNHLTFIRVTA